MRSVDLASFLEAHDLTRLQPQLAGETLKALAEQLAENRSTFLQRLKDLGVSALPDRQEFANALGRARRNGAHFN